MALSTDLHLRRADILHAPPCTRSLPQLAKALDLFVVGICGPKNIEFVKGLGADEVRGEQRFVGLVRMGWWRLASSILPFAPDQAAVVVFSFNTDGQDV